jgi:hypothetical protein
MLVTKWAQVNSKEIIFLGKPSKAITKCKNVNENDKAWAVISNIIQNNTGRQTKGLLELTVQECNEVLEMDMPSLHVALWYISFKVSQIFRHAHYFQKDQIMYIFKHPGLLHTKINFNVKRMMKHKYHTL